MLDKRRGIIRWLFGGRYNLEAYMFALHRITGIGLAIYLPMHIMVTSTRAFGPEAWKSAMSKVAEGPVIHFLEWVLVVGIAIHGLNGLRLILTEFGLFLGKPSKPIYPYKTSIDKQRLLTGVVMIFAAIFMIYSLLFFSPKIL
jgi:succinate dehydrogenase / fumarate reductase cytochrome b subunit